MILLIGSLLAVPSSADWTRLSASAVSPGAIGELASVEGRCPSFSWSEVAGADRHHLAVYRLPVDSSPADFDPDAAELVLELRVPGNALSWTPNLEQCFEAGSSYVWFVRAELEDGDREQGATEWSEGLFFAVSPRPSPGEVAEALAVLRRHAEAEGSDVSPAPFETDPASDLEGRAGVAPGGPRRAGDNVVRAPQRSITTAAAALRARSAASGEAYGVVGISESPDGAGVAAANLDGGADLVLDGSADGAVDTLLSESGIDRPSPSPQTFSIVNSAGGGMTLRVEGVDVVTTATDQDTLGDLTCPSGSMPRWNGIAWTCAQGSLITSLGTTSGLIGGGSVGSISVGIGTGAVTSTHLATGSVTDLELAASSVYGVDIADGTITYSDVNTASVQRRVAGTCASGSSIRTIGADGGVQCESDTYLKITAGSFLEVENRNGASGGNSEVHWYYGTGTPICFLSFVQLRDVDGSGEDAYCYVYPDSTNGRWTLRAHSEVGDDADAFCKARCYLFHYY